jgi:hypothetical protein
MLSEPEGPLARCVPQNSKFTTGEFRNNKAHPDVLRFAHLPPEFYPQQTLVLGSHGAIEAVFEDFEAYKNGIRSAIATQVRTPSTAR